MAHVLDTFRTHFGTFSENISFILSSKKYNNSGAFVLYFLNIFEKYKKMLLFRLISSYCISDYRSQKLQPN